MFCDSPRRTSNSDHLQFWRVGGWVRASTHLEARGLTRAIEELSFKWKPSSLECFEFGRKLHAQDRKRKEEVTGKDENEGRSSMSCIVA